MTELVEIALITNGAIILNTIIGIVDRRRTSKKVDTIHKQINGQQDILLTLTAKSSKAEGKLEEKTEEQERKNNNQ